MCDQFNRDYIIIIWIQLYTTNRGVSSVSRAHAYYARGCLFDYSYLYIKETAALTAWLGERHTEDNITSNLKAPFLIHDQNIFTNLNSSTR